MIQYDYETQREYIQVTFKLPNDYELCTTAYLDMFGRVEITPAMVERYLTALKEMNDEDKRID